MKRAIALSIAGSMLAATSAFAHATLDRTEAPADSFYKAVFGIGHGCDGQPTLRVRVRIPEGITSVKPQPKAGWELTIRREKVPQPLTGTHGVPVTEVVTEVMWSGKLPDDNFDEFLIQVRLPNKAGQTLYFPTVQECETAVERSMRFRQQASSGGISILRRRLRSPPRGIKQVSCSALPMSVVGQSRRLGDVCGMSALPPTTAVMMQCRERQRCARKRHMHRSKQHLYSITLVGAQQDRSGPSMPSTCVVRRYSSVSVN